MLLLLAVLGIGALLGWGLGGAIRNLATVEIRWWPALPAALGLQAIPFQPIGDGLGRYLPFAVLVLSYAVLIAVVVLNRHLRGFAVIFVGIVLNLVPILANQGMPVSGEAVAAVGGSVDQVPTEPGEKHHLATGEDRVVFLADVIAVREPFETVVSIGDVLMYVGAAVFLTLAMLGRADRTPRKVEDQLRSLRALRARPARSRSHSPRPSTTWGSPP